MHPAARYPDGFERRAAVTELRAAGRRLSGYAVTFGTPATIGSFTESIRAGSFTASLATGRDVLALVDHDPSRLLARTGSGTLRLSQDARGLAFDLDLPETTLGRDILAMADRRDLGGMSFGFHVPAGGDTWSGPARNVRQITAADLVEISVVQAFPAYSQTTVSARARSLGHAEATARVRELALAML